MRVKIVAHIVVTLFADSSQHMGGQNHARLKQSQMDLAVLHAREDSSSYCGDIVCRFKSTYGRAKSRTFETITDGFGQSAIKMIWPVNHRIWPEKMQPIHNTNAPEHDMIHHVCLAINHLVDSIYNVHLNSLFTAIF
eukprot:496444_1